MRQLGRYHLHEELGSGGFAIVYKAELVGPEGFKSRVAIKRIHPFLTHNQPGFIASLTNEARLCALFEHPNVVHVYELDSQPDDEGQLQYYMVMELVEGVTLDVLQRMALKRRERLPSNVILDILLQVARGLTYVHTLRDEDGRALKMVHRDLKPSNVLVSREGLVKIFDFGIAKAINSAGPRTATGVTRGTAAFMSPEQAYGKPVNFACDIFAFGAILFELAAGEQLIVADSMAAQLMTVVNTPANYRAEDVENAIPGLGAIFERCRQPKVKDRYLSTSELIDDLRKLRRELDSEVDPPAYIAELYNDPDAQISAEEIARLRIAAYEKVPSTATFFEVPGFRKNRDGKLVPIDVAAESWGVDIASPDAVTRESAAVPEPAPEPDDDDPDDVELETDTLAEYRAVGKKFSPLWLLLLVPFAFIVLLTLGVVVFQIAAQFGGDEMATDEATAAPTDGAGEAEATGDAAAEDAEDEAGEGGGETAGTADAEEPATAEASPEDATGAAETEEPTEEPEPVPAEPGVLKINAYPAATVFIDGAEAGSTFVTARGVELSPGPHTVRMVRNNDGFEQTLTVEIRSGEQHVVPFAWNDPPAALDAPPDPQDAQPQGDAGEAPAETP